MGSVFSLSSHSKVPAVIMIFLINHSWWLAPQEMCTKFNVHGVDTYIIYSVRPSEFILIRRSHKLAQWRFPQGALLPLRYGKLTHTFSCWCSCTALKTSFNIMWRLHLKKIFFELWCLCCMMMFRRTNKQPGIQQFWHFLWSLSRYLWLNITTELNNGQAYQFYLNSSL